MGPVGQRKITEREMRRAAESMFTEASYVLAPWRHGLETSPDDMLRAVGRLRSAVDQLETAAVRYARAALPGSRPVSWSLIGHLLRGWSSRDAARKQWLAVVADVEASRARRRRD